jgi:hypothetical protein
MDTLGYVCDEISWPGPLVGIMARRPKRGVSSLGAAMPGVARVTSELTDDGLSKGSLSNSRLSTSVWNVGSFSTKSAPASTVTEVWPLFRFSDSQIVQISSLALARPSARMYARLERRATTGIARSTVTFLKCPPQAGCDGNHRSSARLMCQADVELCSQVRREEKVSLRSRPDPQDCPDS